MKHLLTSMTTIADTYPTTYFAGANTSRGFVGAYPDLIREGELDRLYILKGGSGTGKSTLIKACAEHARAAGAAVTMLLCSSDPTSADGVILTGKNGRRAAVVDGTAPHTLDPSLPGAVGQIVPLGECWQTSRLTAARSEIKRHTTEKQAAYRLAYRYLAAYGEITDAARALLSECILRDKMTAAVRRLTTAMPKGKAFREETRYTAAVSMRGLYRLSSFGQLSSREIAVLDAYGSASFFWDALRDAAWERRCTVCFAPAPGEAEMPFEAYLPESGIAFRTVFEKTEDNGTTVNMQRFLDRRVLAACRSRLRFADRCRAMLMTGALESLQRAREHHFALEEIYKTAMDFSAVGQIGDGIAREIAGLLL